MHANVISTILFIYSSTYLHAYLHICLFVNLLDYHRYGSGDAQNTSVYVSTPESSLCVFLLLWLYGWSAIPLSYLYSLAFSNPSTAQISIVAINFFTGFVGVLAVLIMRTIPETVEASKTMEVVFRIFPPYLIGEGFINLSAAFFTNLLGASTGAEKRSYFAWSVTGRVLVYMAVEAVGYMLIVLLLETVWVRRFGQILQAWREQLALRAVPAHVKMGTLLEGAGGVRDGSEVGEGVDEDVLAEHTWLMQERIAESRELGARRDLGDGGISEVGGEGGGEGRSSQAALCVRGLAKVYSPSFLGGHPKYAVRGVSFSCPPGERFGLLGINGAGKSTTLGILTGDIQPTMGECFVGGLPLSDPRTQLLIGYCPQVDPLLDQMTSYETLWFFGRIRGIKEDVLKRRIKRLVRDVGLAKHADRPCGTYSGGNKRKLSLALALVGNPRVLFLDEPSTGMDPEARHGMWEAIERVSDSRSVVLVSHSMEECEALCTRVGIMVGGRLQCLGSNQHIKSRFGACYQIEVRCASAGERDKAVEHLLREWNNGGVQGATTATGATATTATGADEDNKWLRVEECHGSFARFKAGPAMDLAKAFDLLERCKQGKTQTHKDKDEDGVGSKAKTESESESKSPESPESESDSPVGILDYSISQATLEQIFIEFAREQEEEKGQEGQSQAEGAAGMEAEGPM